MKRLTFILIAIMLCTVSSSIFAASPQPKDSVEYNARYKVAVSEMIEATGSVGAIEASLNKMFEMMGPSISEEQKQGFKELQKLIITDFYNELIIQMVPIYQKHISLDDIEYFANMYKTPQGRRLKDAMPKIAVDAAEVAMKLGMSLQSKIMEAVQKNSMPK